MNAKFVIKDAAATDITETFWYLQNINSRLGPEFLGCLDEAFERIQSGPEMYAQSGNGIRKMKVKRFPYVVGYLYEDNAIYILGVLHGSRNPRNWTDRR